MPRAVIAKSRGECPECRWRFVVGRSLIILHYDSRMFVHVSCLDAWVKRWSGMTAET